MQRVKQQVTVLECSLVYARFAMNLAHSNGRMAASLAGGRAGASRSPEAAERGPQAASKSLMVLLGDTPCSRSSLLPPTCTQTDMAFHNMILLQNSKGN